MSAALTRLKTNSPVRWTTIVGIMLVPLTVAGLLLWGLWNPTERLENVTAAVVNLDEGAEVDGQTVPLGRVLAGELIAGDAESNFTWVLTDAEDAEAGLDDGRYASVVTIPENFSAAATSLSGDPADAEQATIDVSESDRGRLIDTALSGIVTQTATSVLNQQLGEQFVGGVYVGFNELGDGIGEAADGAAELADGTSQLADGTSELADGATQLADGATQLATGTQQLSSGTSQLASGASELANGQTQLADGVGAYVAGARTLSDSYAQLGAGATAVVDQLQGVIAALTQLQTDLAGPSADLENGLAAAGTGAQDLGADIEPLVTDCYASGAAPEYCAGLSTTLQGHAATIGTGVQTAASGATGMGDAMSNALSVLGSGSAEGGDPNAQLNTLKDGLAAFGTGLGDFAAQGEQLASGAQQSASGAQQLSSGVSELAANVPQLADGASQLADGTTELADGTGELADGTTELADGAGALAGGLGDAVEGIPSTTEAERDALAETAVTPVQAEGASDELFNASGVPLFAGIALWAGALAAFLVLAPLWRRTREAARGVGYITLRSVLPAIGLGAIQGAAAGIVLPIALGYGLAQGAGFFGFSLLAGIAFALAVQGLSALLGGFGRFIGFALLVVAFAVGIVSTVPGPLAAIGDASPVGAALAGFQSIAAQVAGAGGSAVLLVLWGLGGVLLTAFAVVRARRAAA
ncbi:YhgE/Pip domain-containing protein [Leucobacter allii]|uniref:YhgE/Pip domain-containing protein n=1 Tax=Leucobacter allii TaxID=2932247 RepID=UPI001FCFF3A9|nr:YhgE/Pip domain-containing protein [Leucobacter allii]UOR01307.1 YhgE/Pip domain-containing protein [Leucobacter allii]